MTAHDEGKEAERSGGTFSAAAKRAQHAIDSARELAAGADLDQLKAKAADAASTLYAQGRDLVANEDLSKAKDQLSDSIRKNPLAAVGIAFTAGLLLALLTRG
jgi:ElaB/YqjD/DUF883 family membrane-anchored ribosome-binding protein